MLFALSSARWLISLISHLVGPLADQREPISTSSQSFRKRGTERRAFGNLLKRNSDPQAATGARSPAIIGQLSAETTGRSQQQLPVILYASESLQRHQQAAPQPTTAESGSRPNQHQKVGATLSVNSVCSRNNSIFSTVGGKLLPSARSFSRLLLRSAL